MPLWVQPLLRARQEAEENAGLIQKLNSVLVNIYLSEEASGRRFKIVPKGRIVINNTNYVPV